MPSPSSCEYPEVLLSEDIYNPKRRYNKSLHFDVADISSDEVAGLDLSHVAMTLGGEYCDSLLTGRATSILAYAMAGGLDRSRDTLLVFDDGADESKVAELMAKGALLIADMRIDSHSSLDAFYPASEFEFAVPQDSDSGIDLFWTRFPNEQQSELTGFYFLGKTIMSCSVSIPTFFEFSRYQHIPLLDLKHFRDNGSGDELVRIFQALCCGLLDDADIDSIKRYAEYRDSSWLDVTGIRISAAKGDSVKTALATAPGVTAKKKLYAALYCWNMALPPVDEEKFDVAAGTGNTRDLDWIVGTIESAARECGADIILSGVLEDDVPLALAVPPDYTRDAYAKRTAFRSQRRRFRAAHR